ncbi:histidine phosphatase family protein [Paenibacillus sp. GYB006]|uniref:histidine phosphatase family protein n=1 Tax=Paenibacillus sp. GYB006 TaxID=2994394 RepID=UPI002F960C58
MEVIFIRHGHGEHLNDYPSRLNILHPSLTEYGKFQVAQLRNEIKIEPSDLILVSPTKRTIETATILTHNMDFIISPLVGPRMFPQNPELPDLKCDQILSKTEIINLYGDTEVLDFNLDCWKEGINRIEQDVFEGYAKQLLEWTRKSYKKTFIISHDGTITNYRILLGEEGLTRKDFLGEAGVYQMQDECS